MNNETSDLPQTVQDQIFHILAEADPIERDRILLDLQEIVYSIEEAQMTLDGEIRPLTKFDRRDLVDAKKSLKKTISTLKSLPRIYRHDLAERFGNDGFKLLKLIRDCERLQSELVKYDTETPLKKHRQANEGLRAAVISLALLYSDYHGKERVPKAREDFDADIGGQYPPYKGPFYDFCMIVFRVYASKKLISKLHSMVNSVRDDWTEVTKLSPLPTIPDK